MELINLQIEKMVKKNDVMLVTQCRSKQLSDKQETMVPSSYSDGPVNFAAVDDYLNVFKSIALVISQVEYFLRVLLLHMLSSSYGEKYCK